MPACPSMMRYDVIVTIDSPIMNSSILGKNRMSPVTKTLETAVPVMLIASITAPATSREAAEYPAISSGKNDAFAIIPFALSTRTDTNSVTIMMPTWYVITASKRET